MIGIIDYGMGNLYSVANACAHIGLETLISADKKELAACDKLILPGVGAFGDMARTLKEKGLDLWLDEQVRKKGKPLLGICLGMQALFESSYEFGHHQGLGFLKGHIRFMFPVQWKQDEKLHTLAIPHIGWNRLYVNSALPLHTRIEADPYVYFDHSYAAFDYDPACLGAYAQYGPYTIPAIVVKDNVMGCQFHPEKSGPVGLGILEWFGREFGKGEDRDANFASN